MSDYNWENIFKSKSESELLEIYRGDSHLNYEAEIHAGLELKNRNFDFNDEKIKEVHLRKIESLQNELSEFKNLEYKKSDYYKNQKYYFFGIILLIVLLVTNDINSDNEFHFYKAIIYLATFSVSFLTAKWNYNRFKQNKEKTIKNKTELLKELISK